MNSALRLAPLRSFILGLAFLWGTLLVAVAQEADPTTPPPPGPDDEAYAEIAKRFPTIDFMTSNDYDKLIYNKLKGFVSKFPGSRHVPEVRRLISEAETERQKVNLGFRKVDGAWLNENQYAEKKLQLDARDALIQLRERTMEIEPLEFLPLWERYENEFLATPAYLEAKGLAVSQMREAKMKLTSMRTAHGRLMQERMRSLKDPNRLQEAQTAIMAQTAPYERAREEATRLGHRWLPVNPFDLRSINEAETWVDNEIKRLTSFDSQNHKATQSQIEPVVAAFNQGKHDEALKLLAAISPNDNNREMLDSLRDKIKKARNEAAPSRPSTAETGSEKESAPDKAKNDFKINGATIAIVGVVLAIAILAFLFYRWSQRLQKDDK